MAETRNELVTVRKAVLDFGRENVAGIKLTVLSSVDHPVTVEVVEEFPGHFSMADVQVHPGYNPEKWSISKSSRRMVFEDDLAPWGEVESVYGVRVDPENVDPLLNDPTIAEARAVGAGSADGAAPAAETGPPDSADAAGGAGASQGGSEGQAGDDPGGDESRDSQEDSPPDDAVAGRPLHADSAGEPHDEGEPDTPGDPVTPPGDEPAAEEPGGTDQPNRPSDGTFVYGEERAEEVCVEERAEEDRGVPDDGTHALESAPEEPARVGGSPSAADAAAVVEAVARGELSEDQRAAVRAGLGLEAERHQDVQLDHLQAAVAKHAAFADEFEAFVDAVGSPAAALEDLRAAIEQLEGGQDALRDRLDELPNDPGDAADERAALRDRVEALDEAVRTGVDERETLCDRIDEVSHSTRTGAAAREELGDRLDALAAAVDELADDVRRAIDGPDALASRVDALADSVRAAAEERAAFEDRIDEFASATAAMDDARSELRHHLNELLDATRAVAEHQDVLRERFDRLERDLETRREEHAAGLERLDDRVAELEGLFESDEAAALREVIAAEHRWRQRRDELRSRGPVSGSSGSGER